MVPPDYLGPAMQALQDDRQRTFAFLMAKSELTGADAAREAGYSDHLEAAKVRASRLMQSPRVIEAVRECAGKMFNALVPLAIKAAQDVLNDPKHPGRARMAETILDRTGFSARTEHQVTVSHTMADGIELARRLAMELNVEPERLLGSGRPKVIEGEVIEHVAEKIQTQDDG